MSSTAPHAPPTPVPERLAAVIVNHNGWRLVASCARRLVADGLASRRVIVVDNGSTDGSVARLEALLPHATIRANARNRGFAAGCNVGVETALAAGADAVLLLNPDTLFLPGFLGRLAGADGDLAGACTAPEIFWTATPSRMWFAGAWRGAATGRLHMRPANHPVTSVDYLWACCLLLGRSAWRDVGPFEPSFFLYYEDMDWCERARRKRVTMRVTPGARLWHAPGASCGPAGAVAQGATRQFHMSRSAVLFERRWGHTLPRAAGFTRLMVAARTAMWLARSGEAAMLAAHARGWRAGWRVAVPAVGDLGRDEVASGPGEPRTIPYEPRTIPCDAARRARATTRLAVRRPDQNR